MTTYDHAFLQVLQSREELRYILLPDMAEDCEVGRIFFCILSVEPYSNLMPDEQLIGEIWPGIKEHEVVVEQREDG